ncbi:MAG: glycerol-3-phosphate 1-O-acyltransferase PlsY [Planctomycetota bacterium]
MVAILLILGSYLLGAIPFGLLIARWKGGIDIREHGSRNVGATNVVRTLGKPIGYTVFACDVLKGLVPVLVGRALAQEAGATDWRFSLPMACGVSAILGHVFPIYLGFRGGKGVATMFGVFLGVAWATTLIAGAFWLVIYFTTRVVALASIVMALAFPPTLVALERDAVLEQRLDVFVATIALALLVLVRHRSNIIRMVRGEENAFRKKDPLEGS